MAYLFNLMRHFLLHRVICVGGGLFVQYRFFKIEFLGVIYLPFWGFSSDIYAKKVDERGRYYMCVRTLPSGLVRIYSHVLTLNSLPPRIETQSRRSRKMIL